MDILIKNKGIIAGTVLFIAALMAYNLFSDADPLENGALSAAPIDNELVNIANQLSNINYDKTLFTTSGYRFLTDFSTVLPQEPAGRSNPFDAIGRD